MPERLQSALTASAPRAADPRRSVVIFYGADDQPARTESDDNGDGRVDRWEYFDGLERPARVEIDRSYDGQVDQWEYRGERPGTPGRVEVDMDFDGTVDWIVPSAP